MNKLDSPVVIIGAGLAGLACALTLQQHGLPYIILEKSNEVGGRLKTTKTSDNFLLDHGFQVLLTSYPELKYFIDLKKLDLQFFNSGSLIYTPEKLRLLANPFVHPNQFLHEILSNFISLKDKLLVVKLIIYVHANKLKNNNSTSTIKFLKAFGFSDEFIEVFWRPFCAGVYLDTQLDVDSDFFIFLLKNFSTGRVAVPKHGMKEIPEQMRNKLDTAKIKLGVEVKEYSANEVVLTNGEKIKAKAVVCAFNQMSNQENNNNNNNNNNFNSVINYYFTTNNNLNLNKWLLLVPPKYGFSVNNISVMSNVSAGYSENNQQLLSVSIIGTNDPGEAVIANELRQIIDSSLDIKFIKKFKINNALPKKYSINKEFIKNGIYFCGDHLSSPSINGALNSGRVVGEKLMALFK